MKNMKIVMAFLCITALAIGCDSTGGQEEYPETDPGQVAFEQNSKTVLEELEAWQNESVDYDKFYAEDYSAWSTGFGDTDTTNLEQMKEWDKTMFETYDFKIVTSPVNLLPGVDIDTKEIDGSVRLYSEWEVTRSATDTTEAKIGNIRMYHTYVFNEEGKITLSLAYGDFGGLMTYLHSEE
jgi:hypothetical protein